MALSALSGDEAGIVFSQLCDALEPRIAVAFSSISHGLWEPTQAQRQQLRADHEAAAALCVKLGLRSCKELREATSVHWFAYGLTAADLAMLGSLGPVLPALEHLRLERSLGAAIPDGVQLLAEGLGAGALPAVALLQFVGVQVYDTGALALAAALGRGALPRLEVLSLTHAAIGDAGLVALAPALRRLPALEQLNLLDNPLGDQGLAALVAPPPPPGALLPPTGVLTKLKELILDHTHVTNAGALIATIDSGALPALTKVGLWGTRARYAVEAAVQEALAKRAN